MLYKSGKKTQHLCVIDSLWYKYLHLDQISKQNTSWSKHPLEPEDQMRVFFSNMMLLFHTLVVFVQWIKMAQLI